MFANKINLLFACCFVFFAISCSSPEPKVKIETEFGNMILELREDTPQHRDNFLKLVEEGFYDDLLFHRVINQFMLQGGDPNSKGAAPNVQLGSGGPGYTIPAEFTGGLHVKGALAAARTGGPGNPDKKSSGSQFYIVQGTPINAQNVDANLSRNRVHQYTPEEKQAYIDAGIGAPFLDYDYTVFGQVVEGLEVIDKIAAVKVGAGSRPVEDVKMKLSIVR